MSVAEFLITLRNLGYISNFVPEGPSYPDGPCPQTSPRLLSSYRRFAEFH